MSDSLDRVMYGDPEAELRMHVQALSSLVQAYREVAVMHLRGYTMRVTGDGQVWMKGTEELPAQPVHRGVVLAIHRAYSEAVNQ